MSNILSCDVPNERDVVQPKDKTAALLESSDSSVDKQQVYSTEGDENDAFRQSGLCILLWSWFSILKTSI